MVPLPLDLGCGRRGEDRPDHVFSPDARMDRMLRVPAEQPILAGGRDNGSSRRISALRTLDNSAGFVRKWEIRPAVASRMLRDSAIVVAVVIALARATGLAWPFAADFHAYYVADLDSLYTGAWSGGSDAFLYSPLFAQVTEPLRWLRHRSGPVVRLVPDAHGEHRRWLRSSAPGRALAGPAGPPAARCRRPARLGRADRAGVDCPVGVRVGDAGAVAVGGDRLRVGSLEATSRRLGTGA